MFRIGIIDRVIYFVVYVCSGSICVGVRIRDPRGVRTRIRLGVRVRIVRIVRPLGIGSCGIPFCFCSG